MSVQAGIWNFDGRPVDPKLISSFSESLKQQGPDGEFTYADGPIALLYRPFHTTAESRRENQPYISRRGFILTWDGRLDNREELIPELQSELETDPTDVAIVGAAFDCWETDCFRRFVGDWAVSVWSPEKRELVFGVDYMAVRHIFYYSKQNQIWWSTDLSPLVLLSGDRFHIDDNYIAGYFAHEPDAHLTPYREIREVPPGQFVRIRNAEARVERHWRFNPTSRIRHKTDAEYEEHFRHIFRQSVRRRLRSDSPVLAELSGGLDSSSIVCMADEIGGHSEGTFPRVETISYYDNSEPNGDDWMYFRKIEEKRGKIGIHIDVSRFGTECPSFESHEFSALPGVFGGGQRLGDEAHLIPGGACRRVISGMGGDEFLGGISDPRAHLADLIIQLRFKSLAEQLIAWSLVRRKPWLQLLYQSLIGILPTSLGRYLVREAKIEPWIRKDFARRTRMTIKQLDVEEHFGLWLPSRRSCITGVLLMARKLAKFPVEASALGETTYPFLDRNLIEFVLSIPASQMLRPGERRSLMSRSLIGIVPKEILSRRTKQLGVRTPMLALTNHWPQLQQMYQASISSSLGYVNAVSLLNTVRDAQAGKVIPLIRLLRAISLEYWLCNLVARDLIEVAQPTTRRQ